VSTDTRLKLWKNEPDRVQAQVGELTLLQLARVLARDLDDARRRRVDAADELSSVSCRCPTAAIEMNSPRPPRAHAAERGTETLPRV